MHVYFGGYPLPNYESCSTALSPFPSQPLASTSISLFSSVDHGRLISICFAVISHNSSIAAVVPAYWARLPPAPALFSLPAGTGSQLWSRTLHGLVEGFSVSCVQTLGSAAATLCPSHCAACYVLLQSVLAFYTHFVFFQVHLTPRCHAPLPNDSESN